MMLKRKPDARRKDERNVEIYRRALAGETHACIAKDYGINASRVAQIVQREKRFLQSENLVAG